jgi:hypothetical protein
MRERSYPKPNPSLRIDRDVSKSARKWSSSTEPATEATDAGVDAENGGDGGDGGDGGEDMDVGDAGEGGDRDEGRAGAEAPGGDNSGKEEGDQVEAAACDAAVSSVPLADAVWEGSGEGPGERSDSREGSREGFTKSSGGRGFSLPAPPSAMSVIMSTRNTSCRVATL